MKNSRNITTASVIVTFLRIHTPATTPCDSVALKNWGAEIGLLCSLGGLILT